MYAYHVAFGKRIVITQRNHVSKQLLPGLLVDSADYQPEEELFTEGNKPGNNCFVIPNNL